LFVGKSGSNRTYAIGQEEVQKLLLLLMRLRLRLRLRLRHPVSSWK